MGNHGLQHLLEQLPGVGVCKNYRLKYCKRPPSAEEDLTPIKESLTGCARSEGYSERKEFDKFSWLASRYRKIPCVAENADDTSSTKYVDLPNLPDFLFGLHQGSSLNSWKFQSKSTII